MMPSAVVLPWGADSTRSLELPAAWLAPEVHEPDLAGALADYPAALEAALDVPGIWPVVDPDASVALVVDDPSRWTPVHDALPIVLRRLHAAGVRRENVTISVGVGRHAPVDRAAMRQRVGPAIAAHYACFSPPVDDRAQYDDLGTTPEGIPVRVFRPVARARLRILVGSVLPHLQAGFGGGTKLIFPGCCHRSTLGALHRQGLGGDAGRLLGGDTRSNPMRRAIAHAAELLPGECLSISHVLGRQDEVLHVAAGPPQAVQETLTAEVRRRFRIAPGAPADLVVAGNHPWPGDPMQSFKVLLNHRAACRSGGVLVGFFWTDPAEIDRSFSLPALKTVALSGQAGGWILRRGLAAADHVAATLGSPSSFMIRWARELVVDRTVLLYAPTLHHRIGSRLGPIRVHAETSTLWADVGHALGTPPASTRVFPIGGLTYCPKEAGSA